MENTVRVAVKFKLDKVCYGLKQGDDILQVN